MRRQGLHREQLDEWRSALEEMLAQPRRECGGGGTCSGDPVLRVCDGAGPCLASHALALVDDTCGFCPQTTFTCPTSGVYSVLTGAFNAPDQATCDVTAI